MRRTGLLLLVAVLAIGVYVERDRWRPLVPSWVIAQAPSAIGRMLAPDTASASAPASDAANGGGSRRGGGGGNRAVAVETVVAQTGALPINRRTIGYIRPIRSTDIAAETTGLLVEIAAKDGASVKEGDLLARLDDRTAKANVTRDEAAIARDQAVLDNAIANLDRAQRLAKSGATSTQTADDAEALVKQTQAVIGVDQATLEADRVVLAKTELRAPFDGRLGAFNLSIGALVQPGTSVVGITQIAPVYAEFALPDTDLAIVRKAMADGTLRVEVRPSLGPANAPAATGLIVFIDNKIVEASASITLRAELDNADRSLWPGQSIDVRVGAGERWDLVVVPGIAVQPREEGSIVYVVKPDQRIEERKVEVALRAGNRAGIVSGLSAGETVVIEGQVDLANGTLVKAVEGAKTADASAATQTDAVVGANP